MGLMASVVDAPGITKNQTIWFVGLVNALADQCREEVSYTRVTQIASDYTI